MHATLLYGCGAYVDDSGTPNAMHDVVYDYRVVNAVPQLSK